jgi:hypothetical protein
MLRQKKAEATVRVWGPEEVEKVEEVEEAGAIKVVHSVQADIAFVRNAERKFPTREG